MAPYHREMGKLRERTDNSRKRSDDGWIPVMGRHNNQRSSSSDRNKNSSNLFTLFVDNIPEGYDQSWLWKTFSNYGVVKDAFVPNKRSIRTGNRFGFVRFDCHISAGMAIAKTNGVWVNDKKLFVKEAVFGQKQN